MNRAFIQFFSRINHLHPKYPIKMLELCNGLSDTWDFCKNLGDLIWVEHRIQNTTHGQSDLQEYTNIPIKSDEIYISAFYSTQLYQAFLWAKEEPGIKFIVGGPVALSNAFSLEEKLPDNLKIVNKSVEDYFGIENFSYDWKIEPPSIESVGDYSMSYTYCIDSSCYWGKCIFCNYSLSNRKREKLVFTNFPKFEGKQRINLYSPSPSPEFLEYTLMRLPYNKDIRYDLYSRATKGERKAFKYFSENHIMKLPQLKISIGVEFPSNRMLRYMKKGFTVEEILEMIKILSKIENVVINIFLILGWNNLTSEDLKSLRAFMLELRKYKCFVSLTRLFAKVFTPVHEIYEVGKKKRYGPFYFGFSPKLNKEQKFLNKIAYEIIKNLTVGTLYDRYGKFDRGTIENE